MNLLIAEAFLNSFFRIFDAGVAGCTYEEKTVTGEVTWKDDNDSQRFRWYIEVSDEQVIEMKSICDFLHRNKLTELDRVIVTEQELIEKARSCRGEIMDIEGAINALMSTEVKMIDDGVETDSFFIHF